MKEDNMKVFIECDIEKGVMQVGFDYYFVNPGDLTYACLWIPTTEVDIRDVGNDSVFNIEITNLENGEKVYAYKVEGKDFDE